MVKLYVPISMATKEKRDEQRHLISKMIGDGWIHKGLLRLKDEAGDEVYLPATAIEVVILERSEID